MSGRGIGPCPDRRDGARAVLLALQRDDGTLPDAAIVLIDGPSGAGKSSLADVLVELWSARRAVSGGRPRVRLVRLDDVYPGWDGLEPASAAIAHDLVVPLAAGRRGRWRRWDWERGRPAEEHLVDPGVPLVVEGCGSASRAAARAADLTVWLAADDAVRRRRALARDRGAFDAHWDRWQRSFDRYEAREDPRGSAGLVLDGTAAWSGTEGGRRAARVDGMTDQAGNDYIAEYLDGPLAGQTEHRTLDEQGEPESVVNTMVAVNGLETILSYRAEDRREVDDVVQVTFRFDSGDSDTIEPDEDDVNDEVSDAI